MQELNKAEMLNINGGSSIVACTYYGLVKITRCIIKFISSRF
ncbi:MAG: hypothetical protein ACI31R_03265 [Bacilli bacterium]